MSILCILKSYKPNESPRAGYVHGGASSLRSLVPTPILALIYLLSPSPYTGPTYDMV